MLLMTRRPGDTIAIGERIVVRVLEVEGSRVQLGIEAPRDVKVTARTGAETPEAPKK